MPSLQHRKGGLIINRHPHQNHEIQLWFGLGGISVLHRSYWVLCRMKGCCTVQPYRRTTHCIFLLVMLFQSINFFSGQCSFFLRNFRAWVQPKPLALLFFSWNGHNNISLKSILFFFFRNCSSGSKTKIRAGMMISFLLYLVPTWFDNVTLSYFQF